MTTLQGDHATHVKEAGLGEFFSHKRGWCATCNWIGPWRRLSGTAYRDCNTHLLFTQLFPEPVDVLPGEAP